MVILKLYEIIFSTSYCSLRSENFSGEQQDMCLIRLSYPSHILPPCQTDMLATVWRELTRWL